MPATSPYLNQPTRTLAEVLAARTQGDKTMIAHINRIYTRHYTDNGQTTTYVEWTDTKGKTGRTEGDKDNPHMAALINRGRREGLTLEQERW